MAIPKLALAKLTALSEPTRMGIILHLASSKESMPVSVIATNLGLEFVNVSHHLGILEQSGLVIKDKAGRSVIASLNPDVWNSSNKEDTCGYFAFDGFKLALPGLSVVSLKAAAAKPAVKPKAEKPKAEKAPPKKKPAPAPKPEVDDEDDDDDTDE